MFASHGCLGLHTEHVRHDHEIARGDVISRGGRAPFYRVKAVDGEWAWVEPTTWGPMTTVYHAHFQREARPEPAEPAPDAVFTITVRGERTCTHVAAAPGADPLAVSTQAMDALAAELRALPACPFHRT